MMVRLVLVSVVACVGLTLTNVERSRRSAIAWRTNAGSADAERAAREEGRFIVVADALNVVAPRSDAAAADSDDQALQAAWLEAIDLELAPPSATDANPAPAPLAAVESVLEVEDPAYEQSLLAAIEREAAPPSAVEMDLAFAEERMAPGEAQAYEAALQTAIEREAAPPSAVEMDLAFAEERVAPGEAQAYEAALQTAIEREAAPPSAVEMDLAFSEERVAPAVAAPAVVSAVELAWWDAWLAEQSEPLPDVALPAAATAPAPLASGDAEFAAVVDEMAASFALEAGPSTAHKALARDDQPAKGQALAASATVGISAPGENRVAHAVRLTREAVNAWAAVLHGPALVTIGR